MHTRIMHPWPPFTYNSNPSYPHPHISIFIPIFPYFNFHTLHHAPHLQFSFHHPTLSSHYPLTPLPSPPLIPLPNHFFSSLFHPLNFLSFSLIRKYLACTFVLNFDIFNIWWPHAEGWIMVEVDGFLCCKLRFWQCNKNPPAVVHFQAINMLHS